ncbi:hypothetical protein E3O42_00085 [Cryobacterium adonitolivorans]|uniref:Polysaccharide chain length determinant N-terminal domain-containing protein n=1 Tax=Cryobacterium adonitolivorans TaxID=1259189 RepID=A0A4R8WCT7_9MICO|nr:hypothetical protein [Cryobacterium adonitolivorans]TFC07181.1 hypothetical protein E3O42_00085 [Cryobacterium adonitolivorans]
MTMVQLLRVIARQWLVVLAVLVVSALCAVLVARMPGVYSTQASVRLLPPPALTEGANAIGERAEELIDFAALVEKQYNGNAAQLRFASPNATLAGAGIRSGVSVRLVNDGNQWNLNFREPVLLVDVVEPDAERARVVLDATVTELLNIVTERQNRSGVEGGYRVGVLVSPSSADVVNVTGNPVRAVAVTVLLGLSGAVLMALVVDRVFVNRRPRRPHALRRPSRREPRTGGIAVPDIGA